MILPVRVLVAVPVMLAVFMGCAAPKTPPPVDPTKEQIAILQKQLLELQTVQNETRRKIDEQAVIIGNLSSRIQIAEDQKIAEPAPPRVEQKRITNGKTALSKKAGKSRTKKKKPVRRQEQ
jgi:hypothetical protein